MRAIMLLAQLNEIDLTVDAQKARLTEIIEALREPAALITARRGLAQAETDLAHCRAVQKELEAAQSDAADKRARAETRLYGGSVRNPKELEDLQRDVAQLRRQLSQVEDHLLEALICAETATRAQGEQAAAVERLTAEWQRKQTELRVEQAQLKGSWRPSWLSRRLRARPCPRPCWPLMITSARGAAAGPWRNSMAMSAAHALWPRPPSAWRPLASVMSLSIAATAADCCGESELRTGDACYRVF